jgi:hypothetical protein
VTTHVETVIAWNQVDATRRAGRHVAQLPKQVCFVTWPDADGNIFRIESTEEGPIGEPLDPSLAPPEPAEEDWQ